MAQGSQRTVRSIFLNAVEQLDSDEWPAYLERCCPDQQLRQRVERLLRAHQRRHSWVDRAAPTNPLGPGTQIGNYRLLDEIGEGGFGVVYLAEQLAPVCRHVALKIIKPGMNTHDVIARFEAERQALAMLDHPHIARVFDAGTTDAGHPFFVMELVRGVPITQYCDQQRLTIRQRIELMVPICEGVLHAHQKGIIHRDLKPSNVLVALHDDRAAPKIIDFGIAKAISQGLTERTMFTRSGQIMGTVDYMSPEQANVSHPDADTRSDVYSLGVLLYELLSGEMPFDKKRLHSAAFDELFRIIRDEDPPRPSARFSNSPERSAISASRGTDPKRLAQQLRGELDWIVMTSLAKERPRRYQSAGALAADLRRYLNDETVTACPPSAAYYWGKLARRHKTALITASLIAVSLIAGLIGTSLQAYRASVAEGRALASRNQAVASEQQAIRERRRARDEHDQKRRLLYLSEMNLARQAWQTHHIDSVLELLNRHVPGPGEEDLRGFEWYHLWELCEPTLEATRMSLSGYGMRLQYNPSGAVIGVCQRNGRVALINPNSGEKTEVPFDRRGKWFEGFFVAFSADGRLLAYPCGDSVQIRELETGRVLSLPDVSAAILAVAFSPDSRLLATIDTAGGLQLWTAQDAESVERVQLSGSADVGLNCVTFSPDGRMVAAGATDGSVRTWDLTARTVGETRGRHDQPVNSLAFSPANSAILASAGEDGVVRLWDTRSGEQLGALAGHTDAVRCVSFSPDATRIATASRDNTVRLWDVNTRRSSAILNGHSANVYSVAFSPDGTQLASTGGDFCLMLWDVRDRREVPMIECGHEQIRRIEFLPGGAQVATVELMRAGIDIWDLDRLQKTHTYPTTSPVWSLDVSDTGVVVAGCENGDLVTWDTNGDHAGRTLRAHDNTIFYLSISADGQALLTESKDTAALWGYEGGTWQSRRMLDIDSACVALSPAGSLMAVGGTDGRVSLWTTQPESPPRVLTGHREQVTYLAFSRDGQRLASASLDNTVRVWDLTDSEPRCRELKGHSAIVWQCTFLDDQTVASAAEDGTVRLWDARTGQQRFSFTSEDPSFACAVAYCPERRILAAGNLDDGQVRFWHAAAYEDVERLRSRMEKYVIAEQ